MARTKKTEATEAAALVQTNYALPATVEDELAREAEIAAGMEANSGGLQFFGLQGGALKWQGVPVPNNEMKVVVLDHILENVYYEGDYDPNTPQAPSCFAFGRDDSTIAPHPLIVEAGRAQAAACKDCLMNAWGSAEKGRGKACRNTRRLALVAAYRLHQKREVADVEHFKTTAMGFLKLPVTSVKNFSTYVKQLAGVLRRPPHGVVTRVSVVPDAKTQFQVSFELVEPLDASVLATVRARRAEAGALIELPYPLELEDRAASAPAAGAKKAGAKKAGAKKARKY